MSIISKEEVEMEETLEVQCPWCGESFTTFFDISAGSQSYTEDCQVCCRPIVMSFAVDSDGAVSVEGVRES